MTIHKHDQRALELSRIIMGIVSDLPTMPGGKVQLQALVQTAIRDDMREIQTHDRKVADEMDDEERISLYKALRKNEARAEAAERRVKELESKLAYAKLVDFSAGYSACADNHGITLSASEVIVASHRYSTCLPSLDRYFRQ